jgi:hypothetical protein
MPVEDASGRANRDARHDEAEVAADETGIHRWAMSF